MWLCLMWGQLLISTGAAPTATWLPLKWLVRFGKFSEDNLEYVSCESAELAELLKDLSLNQSTFLFHHLRCVLPGKLI